MSEETAAPKSAPRSSAFGWVIVVLGLLIPPLGLIAPTVLAVLGYVRVPVAIFATLFPLIVIFWLLH